MAEGGDFSRSIAGGSDIVYEFVCTPCAGDGSRLEAFQFCQTCDQYLCDTCTKYHQRLQKSHQLKPAGSVKHSRRQPASTKQLVVAKCHFHPDRDVEMYCGTHDMVYCVLCIAKDHRSCKNVDEVKDGVHQSNVSKLQNVVADIDRCNDELVKLKRSKSDNLKEIKLKKADLLKQIDKIRKEMNVHLDQLERKIKAELDEEVNKSERDISNDIDAADDLLTTVSDRKSNLQHNNAEKHLFIAEKLGRKVVSDVNAFLTNASYLSRIKFAHNTSLYDGIKTADNMGKIVRSTTIQQHVIRRQFVVKSCNDSDVKVDTDNKNCIINGMCQLQDGTLLIIDRYNRKLKRLNDQLCVQDACELISVPYGLCSVSSSEVIVRYPDSIQFINVGHSLKLGKKINTKQQNTVYGNSIAYCSDNIWIFGEKCLYIFSKSGTFMKRIDTDHQGQKIFSSSEPISIAVNKDGTKVYVITWGDISVIVFNNNGDVISKLCDKRLDGPCDVCVTEEDIVLVLGSFSMNVLMFDSDGNSKGELVSRKDIKSVPRSLCYDSKECRLLVGGYKSNTIQIFNLI